MAGYVILGMLTLSTLQVSLCAKATCTALGGTQGEQATITCHFKGNVSHDSDSISVHKLEVGNVNKVSGSILDCFWEGDGHILQCYNQSGYTYDGKDWRNLTVIIPAVSEKHVGQYFCQTMLSDADDHVSCTLTLQDTSVPVCGRESEKDPQRESNTRVIVVTAVVTTVLVGPLSVLLWVWVKRTWEKPACCSERKKRKTVTKCRNNGTAIPLVPKIRLLIAGKTGNGKSTLCNTLLGNDHFHTGNGRVTKTTTAQSEVGLSPEDRLEVIDIPDICNSDMTEAERESETSKLRKFISETPTPYVVLVVRCDVVYTADEYALYNKLKEMWESPASFCEHLVVAFCFGDRLKFLRPKPNPTTEVSPKLKSVLEDASNRYVVFNNDSSCTQEEKKRATENLLGILRDLATQDLG